MAILKPGRFGVTILSLTGLLILIDKAFKSSSFLTLVSPGTGAFLNAFVLISPLFIGIGFTLLLGFFTLRNYMFALVSFAIFTAIGFLVILPLELG